MFRSIVLLLAVTLFLGGLHAATEIEPVHTAGSTHELLTAVHSHTATGHDSGQVLHSCHCAAHSPAMILAFYWPPVPPIHVVAASVPDLHGAVRLPPLLRPPNRA